MEVQCPPNVGSTSQTLAHHWLNFGVLFVGVKGHIKGHPVHNMSGQCCINMSHESQATGPMYGNINRLDVII